MGVSMGLTSQAIMSRGTTRQKERWALPLLTLEKVGAWAITEPGSGSDAFGAMKATAKRDGDGYVLDEHFLEKYKKGTENFAQDVDVVMPQLADGLNKLKQSQPGVVILATNGEKNVQIGIDASDCESVFQPFTRPHGRKYPGVGLGLAVCRKIVEAHGGEIRIGPQEGGGAVCSFWLPSALQV